MSIKGYADQEKSNTGAGGQQYVTVNPVREQQNALDVLAHIFHQVIATDAAEAGSTTTVIVATGHAALVGDAINWTSGALEDNEYRVKAVATDAITVSETMSVAPSAADTFKILRPKIPTVSPDGELTVGVTFANDTNYGVVGDDTLRTASQIGNATGGADFNTGVIGAQTLRVGLASDQLSTLATEATLGAIEALLTTIDADTSSLATEDFATQTTLALVATEATLLTLATETTAAAIQTAVEGTLDVAPVLSNLAYTASGKIAGTSLTGSYATLLDPSSDIRILNLFNSCNATIFVSLDGGSTDSMELEVGESVSLDLGANGLKFANAVNISAKHAGAVPTAGTIRASGIG